MKNILRRAAQGALLIAALASCAKGAKKEVLYLFNWTYYTPEEVIARFEKEFNAKVKVDYYSSNEEMFAKLVAGADGYDIAVPSQDYAQIMRKLEMVRELDLSKIPNAKNIGSLAREKMDFDPQMNFFVPYCMSTAGICVNKKSVGGEYRRDWNIFSEERLRGRMCMMDDKREVLGDALCQLGFSPNSSDDTELQAAFELVRDKWKPNLAKFDAEGFGKSFASGDFWVVQGYPEAVFGELDESRWQDIDFFVPECGGPMYLDCLCVLKNSIHYDLALKFIDFIHRPENYALFLDTFRFPPVVNPAAEEFTKNPPMFGAEVLQNGTLKADLGYVMRKYDAIWEKIRQ